MYIVAHVYGHPSPTICCLIRSLTNGPSIFYIARSVWKKSMKKRSSGIPLQNSFLLDLHLIKTGNSSCKVCPLLVVLWITFGWRLCEEIWAENLTIF